MKQVGIEKYKYLGLLVVMLNSEKNIKHDIESAVMMQKLIYSSEVSASE